MTNIIPVGALNIPIFGHGNFWISEKGAARPSQIVVSRLPGWPAIQGLPSVAIRPEDPPAQGRAGPGGFCGAQAGLPQGGRPKPDQAPHARGVSPGKARRI